MKVKDRRNMVEVSMFPSEAEYIAWAEQAPQRSIIITDNQVRYEGFSSALEAFAWVQLFMPEKKEIAKLIEGEALLEQKNSLDERKRQEKIALPQEPTS